MSFPYRFSYDLFGHRDKPAVLFLHGFLGNRNDWDEIADLLKEDFLIVVIDLPGHGRTLVNGIDKYYTMPHCAWGLTNLLNQLQITKCHLVGYSMGGRLALYLAVNYPERFDKIIIESSSPGLKTEAERKARLKQDKILAQQLATGNFEIFIKDWHNQPLFESLKKNHRQQYDNLIKKRLKNNDPALLAKSLRQMGTGAQSSLWPELDKIQAQMLLIAGELDSKFSALANEMDDLCQRSEISIINNCGHNVHLEQPQEYVKKVKQFLTKS